MITSPAVARPDWLPKSVWPFEIHALDVDDARVAYTDVGEGPTMLFSHAGQWSFIWRDLIAELSGQYRCVTFDPPGAGLSQRAGSPRLDTVRDTIGTLIDHLDLRAITLVMHDLGGVTALAAAADRPDRVAGLAAVNTFGWRPAGLLRGMLAVVGSAWMRELDAWTRLLPGAATTRLGMGKNLDRPSRRAFRRGLDRDAIRTMHHLFASARTSPQVYRDAERALQTELRSVPLLTVFGAWSDYFGFQAQWKQRFPHARQVRAGRYHFPMAHDPEHVAAAIRSWHTELVAVHTSPHRRLAL